MGVEEIATHAFRPRADRQSGHFFGGVGGVDQHIFQADDVAVAISSFPRVISRSEEHTSELQSLMRISYTVFCLKKKKQYQQTTTSVTSCNHQIQTIDTKNIN